MSINSSVTDVPIKRTHSTRKRAWYVCPLDAGNSSQTQSIDISNGDVLEEKVLCGHLFNAEAERAQLGLIAADGEECPISLEPIADARLPFSDKIRVTTYNPELTGVELLCGHRFSAVFLLWHWVRSPMICPMCRAPYLQKQGVVSGRPPIGGIPEVHDARPCMIKNFPQQHWRKLRGILRTLQAEEDREERRLIESYHTESVLDETLEVVLGPTQQFFLMLSLTNDDGMDIIQYMPLYRTNDNVTAITEDMFRFTVQRSSLRRFTSAMSNFHSTVSVNQQDGVDCERGSHRIMKSSVVLRVGNESDEHSYLFRIAQLADIALPAFRVNDLNALDLFTLRISSVIPLASEDAVVSENLLERHGVIVESMGGVIPAMSTVGVDVIAQTDVAVASTDVNAVDENVFTTTAPIPNVSNTTTAVTTTDSLSGGDTPSIARTSMFRYTTIHAPCIDMTGLLTLELCEATVTEEIDSLHSVSLMLQACGLLSEVARCFAT